MAIRSIQKSFRRHARADGDKLGVAPATSPSRTANRYAPLAALANVDIIGGFRNWHRGRLMVVQWPAVVLDRYVAPKCSALVNCLAPEVPELHDYFGSFFFNNIFTEQLPERTLSLTNVFLRRFANAVQDYRNGRREMLACIAAPPCSNEMVRAYMRALSHFEASVVNTNLALKAHDTVGKLWNPKEPLSFSKGDGSPCQRLNAVYNALKHFDENMAKGIVPPNVFTPMWLVDDGIESVGSEGEAKLHFKELIDVQLDLEKDAGWIAEEVYRVIQERDAKTNKMTEH